MRISREWLGQYIQLTGLDDKAVSHALTSIGLEVEHTESASPVPSGVVTGKIIKAIQHPNADSLRLCQVDVGSAAANGQCLQIVCGAPNAREGIFVAVAMVGAELPGNFKIKEAKIRGEKSFGMMCSEKELGLSDNHENIIELSGSPAPGTPVGKVMGVDDLVLTLNVTPNRADCLGYIGVARDLSAKVRRPLSLPAINPPKDATRKPLLKTAIEDSSVGQRFCGLRVEGVGTGPSPAWMQKRLAAAGMRPVNVIVDITNYVMLETGQPVHAYDERDVAGKSLIARLAHNGESLKTLDGQERRLVPGDIVICDEQRIIGLAGIMGGENSEVKKDTNAVLIEVAHFNPERIRSTSKRLGLRSEASQRFERGVDTAQIDQVAWRVAQLICQLCQGARITGDLMDYYPQPVSLRTVAIRSERVKHTLARPDLDAHKIKETLESLGLRFMEQHKDEMIFTVPSWRLDLEREADLVEEVARITGFDLIPYHLPVMSLETTPEDPGIELAEEARVLLAQLGMRETISFPFLSRDEFEKLRITDDHLLSPAVRIVNPLSEDFALLQTTLIAGLLKAAANNERHGRNGVRLFEFGRAFLGRGDTTGALLTRHLTARAAAESGRPIEKPVVSGILTQPFTKKSWSAQEINAGFFEGKRIAAQWLSALGIKTGNGTSSTRSELLWKPFDATTASERPYLHPKASCTVKYIDTQGKARDLGHVGEVHPETAIAFDFAADQCPVVFEFDFDAVFLAAEAAAKTVNSASKVLYRFPPSSRDLALVVPSKVTHEDFENAIREFPKQKNLRRFHLFDVYEGSNIPSGQKSMAYSFDFQSPDRTLTDAEVEQEVTALVSWLGDKLEAKQR